MLNVEYDPGFLKTIETIRDAGLKERVKRQIATIIENPETGKPMRYARKGTREVYVPPFRLSYEYLGQENKIVVLALYHKDEQ